MRIVDIVLFVVEVDMCDGDIVILMIEELLYYYICVFISVLMLDFDLLVIDFVFLRVSEKKLWIVIVSVMKCFFDFILFFIGRFFDL